MTQTDVLIIGGSAAGMVSALTGKSAWPEKKFTIIKKTKDVMVPCGIPYIFGTLDSSNQNILPVDTLMAKSGIESIVDEVTSIDKKEKTATLNSGEIIKWDKLVIATGSLPIKPKWLKGADLENVFVIPKDKQYLDEMVQKLKDLNKVVVIGAGFIGVELSDELNKAGHQVTLVEKMPQILTQAFDKELSDRIEDIIVKRGINVSVNSGVKEVSGNGKVEKVILENGETFAADAVVLSMGYKPNTQLAGTSGIELDHNGFIIIDEYMRTPTPDIFAAGDCAQKRDFVTRRLTQIMLASTACAEARVAGLNLFNIHVVKTFSGTIGIYSTAVDGYGFGTAGLTESRAVEEGIAVLTGIFEGVDRHPANLPGAHPQLVKLIAAKYSGVIIGGEVIGGESAGELTNVIGMAIENRMTVNSLLTSQIGTHPMLTASPAGYPLIKAAEIIATKMKHL